MLVSSYIPAQRRRILINQFHPPAKAIEYLFYGFLVYSVLGPAVQLSVPFVGVGMLLFLAAACILAVGLRGKALYRPLALPLAAGISFTGFQLPAPGES